MADYQKQRQARVRAEREQALRDGTAETFADIVRQQPLRVLLTLVAIVFLLGLVALTVWLLPHLAPRRKPGVARMWGLPAFWPSQPPTPLARPFRSGVRAHASEP